MPKFWIQHYSDIPVVCSKCGKADTWTDLTQVTKEALVEMTSLHELSQELVLLKRTEDLVKLFPKTPHPLIRSKLSGRVKILPGPDPIVDHFLVRDSELREFLINSHFLLDDRLPWVKTTVSSRSALSSRMDIRCRECGAYVYLPNDFYTEAGLYAD